MSAVANLLINIVEQIQNQLQREIDIETSANIQDWILENFDCFKNHFQTEDIAKIFIEKNVCSKCKKIIYNHACDCE